MIEQIKTIEELNRAMKDDFKAVQHYVGHVTVLDDLYNYFQYLSDHEVTTVVETELKRHHKRPAGIHPSSAAKSKSCLLKLYYECTHEVEPLVSHDAKSQLTWDLGTLLHSTYQTWFKHMYPDQFEAEVSLKSDDGLILSSTDGIFCFTHVKFILEMKSIKEGGSYGWEKVQAKPFLDTVRQCHFYMKLANAPFALILYLNKNAGEIKEHAITFNQEIWNEIEVNTINPVLDAAFKGGPMVEAKPGWQCRQCSFQAGCKEKKSTDEIPDW
jgi:hypothetical protein